MPQTIDLPARPASNGVIDQTRPMACDPRRAGSRKKKPGDGRARTPPPGFGPTADVLRQRGRIPDISNLRASGHLNLALTQQAIEVDKHELCPPNPALPLVDY